ncbi:MAG: cyclic nucleotide-binding domain-containing protein [Candidatus Pacebacteria bacterium]|nr:cyclic nucleotide-binding domain-containing protein [Candidatus Paceibacterota bacterium]
MLHINVDFIQKVKLFQLSESSFIIAMVNQLKPIICLFGDYIVRRGEMADSMYFLKKGLIRVLCADDENVTLAYLGEGCYFGEIGVLLTGKRSASVVAHTNCVLYDIKKEPLLRILDAFGYHRVFLESVGRQRLQTTYLKDLQQDENISAGANMTNASVMFERTNTLSVSAREMQQQQQRFFIEARSK